jgi:uncharacterized protein YndB with AHSA1/START domain
MRQDLIISESVNINASPERVWEVLTNPEIIKEYLFGTNTVTDWKVGSPIYFRGEYQGTTYEDKGVILKNEPLKTISYSYWSGFSGLEDKPENYSECTYKIESKSPNLAQLTWTQKGFGSEDGYNHSKSGMEAFMGQIKGIAERE